MSGKKLGQVFSIVGIQLVLSDHLTKRITNMKPIWTSKTMLFNLLLSLSLLWPPANQWLLTHPNETLALIVATNVILRLVTKDKVVLIPLLLLTCFMPSCVSLSQPEVTLKFQQSGQEIGVTFRQLTGKNPIHSGK